MYAVYKKHYKKEAPPLVTSQLVTTSLTEPVLLCQLIGKHRCQLIEIDHFQGHTFQIKAAVGFAQVLA